MATITANTNGASDVQAAIGLANDGDTVLIPNGNVTWAQNVTCNKAITLGAVGPITPSNPPSPTVNITHNNGANGILTITGSANGNTTLYGLAFWPNETAGFYLEVDISSSSTTVIMHDCSFSNYYTNTSMVNTVLWNGTSGLIYNCRFTCANQSGTVAQSSNFGWGTTNGCMKIKGNLPWYNSSTFGALDTTGLLNCYVEDCTFEHQWSQAIDGDDQCRINIRHNNVINSQFLTHGITSTWGGRQLDINNNIFNFLPFGTAASNGTHAVNINRWCWWRAGTGRVWGNQIDSISSQDWGQKDSWVFIDEPLTRPGSGNGGVCENESQYPGTRWAGTGGNGTQHASGVVVSPSFVDPIYIWGNSPGPHSDGSTIWGTNDQSGFSCGNPGPGRQTSDVFLLNRDIFLSAPNNNPSPTYNAFTYPHPLRGSGSNSLTPGMFPKSSGTLIVHAKAIMRPFHQYAKTHGGN